jgi:uncharacterized coiled-coil DUF342 family protein
VHEELQDQLQGMHEEFLQNQRQWEEQNMKNEQLTSRLDSVMATLQTIVNNQEA